MLFVVFLERLIENICRTDDKKQEGSLLVSLEQKGKLDL